MKRLEKRIRALESIENPAPEWFWPEMARCFDEDWEGTTKEAKAFVSEMRAGQKEENHNDGYESPLA